MSNLFQDVNGTTPVTADGQPVGLVLDRSRFGEELVTNGTFDTDTSGWFVEGTGATFESVNGQGVLTYGSTHSYANYDLPTEIGKTYNLQFDVISGGGGLSTGGDWDNILLNETARYSINMTATKTVSRVRLYVLGGSMTIDNVSVRQVGSVVLGSELIVNGTFDTDLSGWFSSGGWSWDNGTARLDGDGSLQALNQSITEAGKVYELTVDVSNLSGQFIVFDGTTNRTLQNGTNKFTFEASANIIQFKRLTGSIVTANIDNVSVKEVLGTHASQPVATQRPTYNANPDRLTLDLVDDGLLVNIPVGGWDGYMVVGTDQGTASYGVSLPAGDYELGGDYFFGNTINQVLFREGAVEPAHLKAIEYVFIGDGAKESYGDVTDFDSYWRQKNITEFPLIDTSSGTNFNTTWFDNNLTSFPLIDTSSGTNFGNAWRSNNLTSFPLIDTSSGTSFSSAWTYNNLTSFPLLDTSSGTNFQSAWNGNNLTSFPLIDTSSGTNFRDAWLNNNTLADFPANMFDNCLATNFTDTFLNTGLTQASIDGILVSINSNGTSNGTFTQSGGSAPSAVGESAIDAMRSRGWTITVTGGY